MGVSEPLHHSPLHSTILVKPLNLCRHCLTLDDGSITSSFLRPGSQLGDMDTPGLLLLPVTPRFTLCCPCAT